MGMSRMVALLLAVLPAAATAHARSFPPDATSFTPLKSDDGPPAGWLCRCTNQTLCSPLSATPRVREREVFAYYEDAYGLAGMERLLASGQVTTIAACGGDDRLIDDHLCMAHAAGVRVVMVR
jgi:hypothetical protein